MSNHFAFEMIKKWKSFFLMIYFQKIGQSTLKVLLNKEKLYPEMRVQFIEEKEGYCVPEL